MNFLEQRILKDGVIKPNNVLKVDSFLNHQLDVALLDEIGEEFKRRFADKHITKVLTIEASGIAIACSTARCFGVPVVFAKKSKSINLDGDMLSADVESYTHRTINKVIVAKKFIRPDDHVLIVDDFLANGEAAFGAIRLLEQAGATAVGVGAVIAKAFQPGMQKLRDAGYRVEALAPVSRMAENLIEFE